MKAWQNKIDRWVSLHDYTAAQQTLLILASCTVDVSERRVSLYMCAATKVTSATSVKFQCNNPKCPDDTADVCDVKCEKFNRAYTVLHGHCMEDLWVPSALSKTISRTIWCSTVFVTSFTCEVADRSLGLSWSFSTQFSPSHSQQPRSLDHRRYIFLLIVRGLHTGLLSCASGTLLQSKPRYLSDNFIKN